VIARPSRIVFALLPFLAIGASCVAPTEGTPAAPIDQQIHGTERYSGGAVERTNIIEVQAPAKRSDDSAAILIVLDGARWQDVYNGADPALGAPRGFDVSKLASGKSLMPNLHELIETRGLAIGAPDHGEPIVASGPSYISLPGYMEIMTGARAKCFDNECGPTRTATIADEVRATGTTNDVAVVTSWPTIENAAALDTNRIVLSAGCHHSKNANALRFDYASSQLFYTGEEALPWPGDTDYRPDALTAQIALKYLAKKHPRFLFIGLGDMDEYAHKNDYRDYVMSMQHADKVIGEVVKTLATMGERGAKTTIFVTADHGRADDFRTHGADSPESSRVFLIAAGGGVPVRGMVDAKKKHHLADIVPTMRTLLGLPQKSGEGAGEPIAEIVAP
jgi:hypothetical protein